MLDLTDAVNCLSVQKENGTYCGEKIGRIRRETTGLVGRYIPGEVVLFREELEPTLPQFGEKQTPSKTVTIESPMCQRVLDEERKRGSLITTICTMIGVPREYVEEIRI